MSGIEGKVVIVTGASSGIGEETVRTLARGGAMVMAAARREDRLKDLQKTAKGDVAYTVTDVADRASMGALARSTIDRFGRIDVLVNNAGIMPLSFFETRQVDNWERMVDVNIKGVLYGIDAVLTLMLEQGHGHIINVSSVAGHRVNVASGVYSGTKFAVMAISEGLRQETAGRGVRVTVVSPGAVTTELGNTISDPKVMEALGGAFSFDFLQPEDIANGIAYAISQPEHVSVNEILIRPSAQPT